MPRKSPGGPRDAVLNVRVPARVKYGLELVGRLYSEGIPDIVVRALDDVLTSENGGLLVDMPGSERPVFLLPLVWDERECVRLVKLALTYPALLTRAEQAIWSAVRVDDRYWAGVPKTSKSKRKDAPIRQVADLHVPALEADWARLTADAAAVKFL